MSALCTSRRGLLGTVGSGLLGATAGCLDLEFLGSDESPQRFDADELEPILSQDAPDVVRPAPVQPSEAAVEDVFDRCDTLIATVPDPLSADDVPNGTVRREIKRVQEIALRRREELAESTDRFRTLTGVYVRARTPERRRPRSLRNSTVDTRNGSKPSDRLQTGSKLHSTDPSTRSTRRTSRTNRRTSSTPMSRRRSAKK